MPTSSQYGQLSELDRTLDATMTTGSGEEADRRHDVHRLLDAVARLADADARRLAAAVAERFLLSLDSILHQRAELGVRAALINRAREILDRLAKADPGNADWEQNLAVSHSQIGVVHLQQGNLPVELQLKKAPIC